MQKLTLKEARPGIVKNRYESCIFADKEVCIDEEKNQISPKKKIDEYGKFLNQSRKLAVHYDKKSAYLEYFNKKKFPMYS